ncbi:MAG: DUF4326 domain-containing protein, partial [Planctomycetaceae bacterium]|nr:DUF4326 domain-containing protein [Planctomycetaceae bacterium]
MSTTVVNILKDDCSEGDFVYIGRQNNRLSQTASKWANPFVEGKDGTRTEVIEQYRQWIQTQPELMAALPELRGKVLGCYCKPKACHGDVLVAMVDSEPESASTAIAVCESALAKSERQLADAMQAAFSAFYSQGLILERILTDKEFKEAGFDT